MEVSQSNLGHDANSIIMKITTGLQSGNLGLQCEAIAEFPNIVKKYPFPVVISPIFVQIIESFHRGPNYLRQIVWTSCNTCREHLGKLTCASDIIGNLSLVMVSNDPCARALCLRLLAILHAVFRDNKSVHHMIILSLDSHYDIELSAAIEASNSYAPISSDFAGGLCHTLCLRLESLSTDLQLKIELIKLARYFHHKSDTIEETRHCLLGLLDKYRSLEFVVNIVDTLTILATRSSLHARSQIDVLVHQIDIEDREPAILAIFDNQSILARRMSHVWTEDHISFLCRLFHKSDPIIQSHLVANSKIIEILSVLAESSSPASIFSHNNDNDDDDDRRHQPSPKSPILVSIIECATSAALIESDNRSDSIVYRMNYFGINLLALISIATRDRELAEHALNTFHSNVGNLWRKPDRQSPGSPDLIGWNYSTILKLLNQFPDLFQSFLARNVSFLVDELMKSIGDQCRGFSSFCRFMTKFCLNLPRQYNRYLPSASSVIDILCSADRRYSPDQYLSIFGFVFQLANCEGGLLIGETDQTRLIDWVNRYQSERNDHWLIYRLGRMANRYNQHGIAVEFYRSVLPAVSTPQFIYWIRGLIEVSEAERLLMSLDRSDTDLIDNLMTADKHFYQATNQFKCSGAALWWPDAYVKIRCRFLNAVYILAVTLNQYGSRFNTRNMKLSAMNENKSLFKSIIAQISDLIGKSIDADDDTINQLEWLKRLASLFLQTLQNYHAFIDCSFVANRNSHQDYWMKKLCEEIASSSIANATIDQQQPQILVDIDQNQSVADKMRLLMTLAVNAVRIGVPFPRFMFQKLQTTEVRLMAILNGKTVTNESTVDIPLRQDQSHKLQVFGIIQQRCKIGKPIRVVNRVQISISLVLLQTSKLMDSLEKPLLVVDKIDKLKNDYFSTYVLLDLKKCSAVKYQLLMKASPIDTTGVKWETREISSCIIKVESMTNGVLTKPQMIR